MLRVQSCCFAYQIYCFFEVLAAVAVVVAKAPCYFCSWGQTLVAVATREVAVVGRFREESKYLLSAGTRKVAVSGGSTVLNGKYLTIIPRARMGY